MIEGSFLVDAHVHCHACFEPARFFDCAAANFRAAAMALGLADFRLGCLMLSEVRGVDFFAEFRDRGATAGGWRFMPTADACGLLARHDDGSELLLIAGRQIETAEKLEVLALATTTTIDDGQPLAATVAAVRAAGAIAVLPWCFGKWMFGRGAILSAFLRQTASSGLFLGDNGRRWGGSRPPSQFRLGRRRGLLLLPGSDPLPMPDHVDKAASYGFALHGRIELAKPASALHQLIGRQTEQPALFGQLERLRPFCHDQLRMQLRKRGIGSWS